MDLKTMRKFDALCLTTHPCAHAKKASMPSHKTSHRRRNSALPNTLTTMNHPAVE
jgi:hypothetical protein